jgi:flagellar biosynthesis GTPase FlhF
MAENFLVASTLGAFAFALYGCWLLLFANGKRLRGLKIIIGSALSLFPMVIIYGVYINIVVSRSGFEDHATYEEARQYGVTDPQIWAAEGAEIRANAEAEAIREDEEAQAARLAAAAEAAIQRAEEEALRDREAAEEEARRQREAAQRAAERAAERERQLAEERAARRTGFHCLSSWDGSHRAFRDAVRDQMREPNSFEHIETRVTPVDENGMHTILMQYRARNGFGGMNVGAAFGQYRNDNCNFIILTIE